MGGDRLPHDNDAGSLAANLLKTKLLINSTISDARKSAQFICLDAKDHFLATPMKGNECLRAKLKYFPKDIRKKYNLSQLVTDDNWIYIETCKGMPGLKQAAILAYQHLKIVLSLIVMLQSQALLTCGNMLPGQLNFASM